MEEELEVVDILESLDRLSLEVWVTDRDLRRNLIAKKAYQEIVSLRRKLALAEEKEYE